MRKKKHCTSNERETTTSTRQAGHTGDLQAKLKRGRGGISHKPAEDKNAFLRTHSRTANTAALALSVSKMVSTMMMSDPPSTKPFVCSLYATTSSSNVTLRNDGSSTSYTHANKGERMQRPPPRTKTGEVSVDISGITDAGGATSYASRFRIEHTCGERFAMLARRRSSMCIALKLLVLLLLLLHPRLYPTPKYKRQQYRREKRAERSGKNNNSDI